MQKRVLRLFVVSYQKKSITYASFSLSFTGPKLLSKQGFPQFLSNPFLSQQHSNVVPFSVEVNKWTMAELTVFPA